MASNTRTSDTAFYGRWCRALRTVPTDVMETILDGLYDDTAGDVDVVMGLLTRVDEFVVHTDAQGFDTCFEYESVADAIDVMASAHDRYTADNPCDTLED